MRWQLLHGNMTLFIILCLDFTYEINSFQLVVSYHGNDFLSRGITGDMKLMYFVATEENVFLWEIVLSKNESGPKRIWFTDTAKSLKDIGRTVLSTVRKVGFKSCTTVRKTMFIWAASWQNQQCGYAPSEDSVSLGIRPVRVFAVRMKKAWVLSYPLSAQRRLWSDWADDQADLSLRWAHTHFVGFVMSRLMLISLRNKQTLSSLKQVLQFKTNAKDTANFL